MSKKSSYAAAIRAAYQNPRLGDAVFRISPDVSRDPKKQASVRVNTADETPYKQIFRAAPVELQLWCHGFLAASDAKAAEALLEVEPIPSRDMWKMAELGARAKYLRLGDDGKPVDYDGRQLPVTLDEHGNVWHPDGTLATA